MVTVLNDHAASLGIRAFEIAGVLGVSEADWSAMSRRACCAFVDPRLGRSLRLLCELLGLVLMFSGGSEAGAQWMRTFHPAMGDTPMGRLIRSPDALGWLVATLRTETQK